jgi:hypothetical protein
MEPGQRAGQFVLAGFPVTGMLVLPERHLEPASLVDLLRQQVSGPGHEGAARHEMLRDRQLQGQPAMVASPHLRHHRRRPQPDYDIVRVTKHHRLRCNAEAAGNRDRSFLWPHDCHDAITHAAADVPKLSQVLPGTPCLPAGTGSHGRNNRRNPHITDRPDITPAIEDG